MSKWLTQLPKFLPLLPQLFELIMKLIGVFKKKHDPAQIESVAGKEVKQLAEDADSARAKEEAEWKIVRGED